MVGFSYLYCTINSKFGITVVPGHVNSLTLNYTFVCTKSSRCFPALTNVDERLSFFFLLCWCACLSNLLIVQSWYIQVYFGMLDALLAAEELPEEYRDRCQVHLLTPFPHTFWWWWCSFFNERANQSS